MLLNLSNHPSVHWSKEQMEMALNVYGAIEDLPFPNVPSELSTEGVIQLAKDYAERIAHYSSPITHVHLMGEMTFVVALVRLLQSAGIIVVCSTTNRIVLEELNGQKTVKFEFVQFRVYD